MTTRALTKITNRLQSIKMEINSIQTLQMISDAEWVISVKRLRGERDFLEDLRDSMEDRASEGV